MVFALDALFTSQGLPLVAHYIDIPLLSIALVLQARPFLFCSADHFQCAARERKLKAIGAAEQKGSGLETNITPFNSS